MQLIVLIVRFQEFIPFFRIIRKFIIRLSYLSFKVVNISKLIYKKNMLANVQHQFYIENHLSQDTYLVI